MIEQILLMSVTFPPLRVHSTDWQFIYVSLLSLMGADSLTVTATWKQFVSGSAMPVRCSIKAAAAMTKSGYCVHVYLRWSRVEELNALDRITCHTVLQICHHNRTILTGAIPHVI